MVRNIVSILILMLSGCASAEFVMKDCHKVDGGEEYVCQKARWWQ